MTWKRSKNPFYPWIKTFDNVLSATNPPDIYGDILYITSDYSGTEKKSQYHVSTIVCADLTNSATWELLRRKVRQDFLADGRRMSYKNLSDRQRAKALIPFLKAASHIKGLCLTIIIKKSIKSLCLEKEEFTKFRAIVGQLSGKWKDKDIEEALRLTSIIGYLVGAMSKPEQDIYWISDEDNLFANTAKAEDMSRFLSIYTTYYTEHPLGELGIGTTAIDEDDRLEEDFAAVADLVPGSISEIINKLSEHCSGKVPTNLAIEYSGILPEKAETIGRWFWLEKSSLKRVAIIFEKQPGNSYSVSRYEMVKG